MGIGLTCDYCKENEAIGVYAADHGPFSLAECEECLEHRNLRTKGNALSKWGRLGDKAFDEYKYLNQSEPKVHFNGEYILLREFIKILTEDDVHIIMGENPLKEIIVERLKNEIWEDLP